MVKGYLCVSCSKPVRNNHKGIQCTKCHKWVHIECVGIPNCEYDNPCHEFLNWECPKCMLNYLPNYINHDELPHSSSSSSSSSGSNVINYSSHFYVKRKNDSLKFQELSQKGLRILHLNVRSLTRNFSEIHLLLTQNRIDILSLNETWLDDSILDQEIEINGYRIVRKDRNRHGGGVLVYLRNNLHYHVLKHSSLEHLEAIPLIISPDHSKAFIFMTWYRPPNSPICLFDYYEQLVSFIDSLGRNVIIMGDVNCDIMKDPISNDTKHLNEINTIYSLAQINTTDHTRCSDTSISLIDHMLTNSCDMVKSHGVIHSGISDHSICFLIWNYNVCNKAPEIVSYRKMRNFDENAFLDQLRLQPWHKVHDKDNMEEAVKVWEELFMEVINNHMPIRHKRVKNRSCPWMCPEIIELIKDRDKQKNKARKVKIELLKTQEESTKIELKEKHEKLWNKYRKLRNHVTLKIRKCKRSYFSDKLASAKTSSEMWNVLKSVLPHSSSNSSQHKSSNSDGSEANVFNQYFANIGSELASNIPSASNQSQTSFQVDSSSSSTQTSPKFSFQTVSEDEVSNLISSMENKKSVGVDGISMHMLKISAPAIVPCLTYLFNKSLSVGDFPLRWKQAKIIPLHKSGDKTLPCNYRPIAILPSVSKILEKIAGKQFSDFLKSRNILSDKQSGFRQKHSTVTALTRVSDDWLNASDNGKYTGAVLIDMKKAFDTVDISILLKKIMRAGAQGSSLAWFESYLTNRQICTYFCSEMSEFVDVNYGVPQGSILGPLLFTLYIDDIVQQVEHCDLQLYADDTILYYSHEDVNCIDYFLNSDLKRIHDWMCSNKLSLNVDKTECILFGTRSMLTKRKNLNVQISGKLIQCKEAVKYLGVIIDQELKWNDHIEYLCKRISKLVNFLGRLRVFINEHNLKLIYRTIILPLFDYADVVYDSSNLKYTDRLQKLQNRAGRIILGINPYKHISNHELHQLLNWESLKSRRVKHTVSLVYKSLNNLSAPYMQNSFQFVSHPYNLRSDGNLSLPKPHTDYCKRMFSYRGASSFNNLPRDAKSSISYSLFLKEIDQHILKWL